MIIKHANSGNIFIYSHLFYQLQAHFCLFGEPYNTNPLKIRLNIKILHDRRYSTPGTWVSKGFFPKRDNQATTY